MFPIFTGFTLDYLRSRDFIFFVPAVLLKDVYFDLIPRNEFWGYNIRHAYGINGLLENPDRDKQYCNPGIHPWGKHRAVLQECRRYDQFSIPVNFLARNEPERVSVF